MAPKKEDVGGSSGTPVKRGRGRPPKHGRGGGGRGGGRGRGRGRGQGGGDFTAEETDGEKRSSSPVRSGSPISGYWDEFPISEFLLTLYDPINRTQWLPRAVADVLEGDGPFRFLLHRVGARQGPWEVFARVAVSREGEEARR